MYSHIRRADKDSIMAEKCRIDCGFVDEWMLVEMGEHGPIALEESEVTQMKREKDLNLDSHIMKTYYFYNTKDLFQDLPKMMPRRPKGILLILPKCQTQANTFDKRGSTKEFNYQVKAAPTKGAPDLAERTNELLFKAGMKSIRQETSLLRGVEHWTRSTDPLSPYSFDIPVCQLSIHSKKDATFHYNLGQALTPLKHEDVLIVGLSDIVGATDIKTCGSSSDVWTKEFDKWLNESLLNQRFEEIIQFEKKLPQAGNAISSADCLYPLLLVMGAAGRGAIVQKVNNGWSFCSYF